MQTELQAQNCPLGNEDFHRCLIATLELAIYLYLKLDHDFTSDGFMQHDPTAFSGAILVDIGASKVKERRKARRYHVITNNANSIFNFFVYCYPTFRSCFSVLQPFQAEALLMLMTSASMSIPQTIAGF